MRYGRPIRLPSDAYESREARFHIVVRTHPEVGKLSFPVREAIWRSLMTQRERPEVHLSAAVLMPDHVHLIAGPGSIGLVRWVGHWKSISTRAAWSAGHHGTLWQRRFFDRRLRNDDEFEETLAYIIRNPQIAGLIGEDGEWPHSWVGE
jgi:putative transposase